MATSSPCTNIPTSELSSRHRVLSQAAVGQEAANGKLPTGTCQETSRAKPCAKPGPQMHSVLPGYSFRALTVYHPAQTSTARSAQGLQAWWLGVQRRSKMSFALRKLTPLARTLRSSESSLQQQQLQRRGMAAGAVLAVAPY